MITIITTIQESAGGVIPKFGSSDGSGPNVGRAGMPEYHAQRMYRDYLRLHSLSQVGKLHGRSRQSVYEMFRRRGLKLYPRWQTIHPVVEHRGRKYTPGKGGYLRDTNVRKANPGRESMLQRVIWREQRGDIPAGHEIIFRDGNKANCAIENLDCLPRRQARGARASGQNGFTRSASSRLGTLLNNFATGRATVATALKK